MATTSANAVATQLAAYVRSIGTNVAISQCMLKNLAFVSLAYLSVLTGCGTGVIGDFEDHDVDDDFTPISITVPGIPNTFNQNNLMSDSVFTRQGLTGNQIQQFLENAPYFGGMRSWLADVEVSGMRASDAIVAAAEAKDINPLMLLARLQVERSAISRTNRPSQHRVDYAMGCGCHDGQSCNTIFRGFDKQMLCAAETLRKHYDRSVDQSGSWRKGRSKNSLDGKRVTPQNHATASLYAYTPWVLPRSGGAWLVWNVSKKYATTLDGMDFGDDHSDDGGGDDDGGDGGGGGGGTGSTWTGGACVADNNCQSGDCLDWFDGDQNALFGICSTSCAGLCADSPGQVSTFCVEVQGGGQCVQVATGTNSNCVAIPGTKQRAMPRYTGSSSSSVWKNVCVPANEGVFCSVGASDGVCIDTNANSCSGSLHSNACPGPNAIRCCVP